MIASLALGLLMVLTLWLTGSGSSAGILSGPAEASPWWDRGSRELQDQALRLRAKGDFRPAERLYQLGLEEARRRGDSIAAIRFLISIGGCRLGLFEYRAAMAAFLEARTLALAAQDRRDMGSIDVNLSSLYLQLWDRRAARAAVEEGLAAIEDLGENYARPYLLLQRGQIEATEGDARAQKSFEQALEAARAEGNFALEAQARDLTGAMRLGSLSATDADAPDGDARPPSASDLEAAEQDFEEAYRLRRLFDPGDLGFSYSWLGAVKLARGDLAAAERLTSLALEAAGRGAPSRPAYVLRHQEGRLRLARGDTAGALAEFSAALELMRRWRLEGLPARSTLTSLNIALDREVYRSFIELAGHEALRSGDPALAAQSFAAVEANRAASLRESLALAETWRARLPKEYWEYRGRLGSLERRMDSPADRREAERLALRITEMEAVAGMAVPHKKEENFSGQTSLIHFQEGLSDEELLLSFSLGKSESFLWAVSRDGVQMYRLAGAEEIAGCVRRFREALQQTGSAHEAATTESEARRLGAVLYRRLFGQLGAREQAKPAWLLSLEGVLFDVPFAALVPEVRGGSTVYLVERHSLEAVPGALLLRASAGSGGSSGKNRFIGVGDPIYNAADPRWRGSSREVQAEQFQRLVGSGAEVAESARSWRETGGPATVLTGEQATRSAFLEQLASSPAAIHLATHVLVPENRRETAFIAFGFPAPQGATRPGPEYLSTSEITALHVPGALVVMSGCGTGLGDAKAGAGLLGLTRAWLMAGASGVITTGWPVQDSSGEIFASFYRHWHPGAAGRNQGARALQASQVEMIRSGTWRAAPSYWAAYQITGGFTSDQEGVRQ